MNDMIKDFFFRNSRKRQRRFLMDNQALEAFGNLSKSCQHLLIEILKRIRSDNDINALIVSGVYHDFGYTHRTNFSRDRKRLKEAGFIIYERDQHFVNPCMIEYHNKKQKLYLLKELGMHNEYTPKPFGSNNK